MIEYLLLNPDGSVMQRGYAPSTDSLPVVPGKTVEVVTKADKRKPPAPKAPTHRELRIMDYPTIGDQLDAIWKILDTAGLTDKSSETKAVLDKIKAVKAKHQKND